MRFLSQLPSLLLLSGCAAAAASRENGAFVTYPRTAQHETQSLSIEDARLAISTQLGLSKSFKFGAGKNVEDRVAALNRLGSQIAFQGAGDDSSLYISILGLQKPKDILSQHHAFDIASGDFSSLVPRYFSEVAEKDRRTRPFNPYKKEESGSAVIFLDGDVERNAEWDFWPVRPLRLANTDGTRADILKRSGLDNEDDASQQFVDEYILLKSVFEDIALEYRRIGGKLFAQFGALNRKDFPADKRSRAEELLSALIETHGRETPFTLLLLPHTGTLSHPALPNPLSRRANEEALSLPPTDSPATTSPSSPVRIFASKMVKLCAATEDDCNSLTNKCNGRGKCTKYLNQKACWQCECKRTKERIFGKSDRVYYWAGSACEKQDISVQFNLFLGLGIVMTSLVVGVIYLLLSVGSEELPGVLSAGVAGAQKR